MLGRTDSRARLLALMLVMAVVGVTLVGRLAYWQLAEGADLRALAQAQLVTNETTSQPSAERGDITDRGGALLATTAYRDLLAAYPDMMARDKRAEYARTLGDVLGFSPARTAQLVDAFDSAAPYVIVARRLTDGQSQAVRDAVTRGEVAAVNLEAQPVRFYPNAGGAPNTSLASQLLGFVTADGKGSYGVEQADQGVLAGQDGATADTSADAPLPKRGSNVQLTIDASLQLRLEKELYATWIADSAPRVSGLVMDADTGAVLAWGSVPGYDANDYASVATSAPELFADPLAGQIFEPGSVMKMFTAAAAFEQGAVDMDSIVFDTATLDVDGYVVRDADRKAMGPISFADAVAFSRNVAIGRVAYMLGETTTDASTELYSMWRRLGLGSLTGIDLPAESAGLVADPVLRPWSRIDLVNRSFGQGVAVTTLQLAVGYAAMANGGMLVVPHVVAAVDDQPRSAPQPTQAISADLAARLRALLIYVVQNGPRTTQAAQVPGYVVGGKTGTAQIWDAQTQSWQKDSFNSMFAGFVSGAGHTYIIVVRIHDAGRPGGQQLEVTPGELFRRIASNLVDVLNVPPAD
jgi:cell division protein FtsI (penicillin-binding protein 3)